MIGRLMNKLILGLILATLSSTLFVYALKNPYKPNR